MNSPLCDSNFNLFSFLVAAIAFSMSLRHMLFIKLKTAYFKRNICFETEKNQCVYTSQETQWAMGTFLSISDYHMGIPS